MGRAFDAALRAKVTDAFGNPVSGAAVTFTAPASGPGGTFAGGSGTATVLTDAAGVATAPAFTANAAAGSYAVTATVDGAAGPATFSLNNTLAFRVTTAADSGSGSLRQAILDANRRPGPDDIVFDLPGGGVHTITVSSPLPTLTDAVTLDATTQPGYAGTPVIELDGSQAGAGASGLTLSAGGSVVRGLAVNRFGNAGIRLLGGAGSRVEASFVGTDASGTAARGNGVGVVLVNSSGNVLGGEAPGARDLISGNAGQGVLISGTSTGNVVAGDYIGTDVSGTKALGNGYGVYVSNAGGNTVGGTSAADRNVISGNAQYGVVLTGATATGNVVEGNYVGTDAAGTHALGNSTGVYLINAGGNTVGGPGAGNLLSGNRQNGLVLRGAGATGNVVAGNYVGTDDSGTAALGNAVGVLLDGAPGNTVGGASAAARNVISGNAQYGVVLTGATATGNVVAGNYVGTDGSGTAAVENGVGIQILNAADNTIGVQVVGGMVTGAGNLISGNHWVGVEVVGAGATGNAVRGNVIGLGATGAGLGNRDGVVLRGGAWGNVVGGTAAGAGNTIALGRDGVRVDGGTGNAILGNAIFAAQRLGIDLVNGGNNAQAAPVVTSATRTAAGTTVAGTLSGAANATYTVEFFSSSRRDASGNVQGQQLLGRRTVTTDGAGQASFTFDLAAAVPAGYFVTASATDAAGNTSAFAVGVQAG